MTTLSLLHQFKSQQQRFATTNPVLNHNADTVSVSNWCGKRMKDTLSLHYLCVDTLMMIQNAKWNSSMITDSGSSSVHNDTGLISALLSGWRVILSVPHRSGLEGRGYLQGGLTGVLTWKLRKTFFSGNRMCFRFLSHLWSLPATLILMAVAIPLN